MKKIGVIGTGIMGAGIAINFLKKGHTVSVWNRNPEKTTSLQESGATVYDNPKQVTEQSDIIFEVTANDESSRSVWLDNNGILSGASKEKILITCATLSIKWTDELIEKISSLGLDFMDLPMTGGRIGAETGQLILLGGGNENTLDLIKTDLDAISSQVYLFGPAGSGMRYKLILNALQGIHILALGESLKLAKQANMDMKKVGDALAVRPGGTTTNLAWRDYQQEPNPINFSIRWILKDLNYAKEMSGTEATPFLDETLKRYQKAVDNNYGEKDWVRILNIDQ